MPRKSTRDVKPDAGDQDVYVIKTILEYERRKGTDYYLVEWLGYPIEQATWEPRSNFVDPDVETLERLTSLKAQYLEEKKKQSVLSSASAQSNGTTPATRKSTGSLDVSEAGIPVGDGELSQLRRVSTQNPAPSKRRASRLSNGSAKRARTMTASNGPADNSSGMSDSHPEEGGGHIKEPSSEISVSDEKDKKGQEHIVSRGALISSSHLESAQLNQQEDAPSSAVPDLPVKDIDTAPSAVAAEIDKDQLTKIPASSQNAVEAHSIPGTSNANEPSEEETLSVGRSRLRRRDSQEAPPLPLSPTDTTQTTSEEKNDSVPTCAVAQKTSDAERFTSPAKPVQSETTDPMLPTKPSSKEPFAPIPPLQSAEEDTNFSPRTTSHQPSDVSSDPTTSAPREQSKTESAQTTTKPVGEAKTPITTSASPAAPQSPYPPASTVAPPSPVTSRSETLACAPEPAGLDVEAKAVAPVTVEQVRVKSLRQDDTHGLCGTIALTNSLGEVEESRLPISEVRRRHPEELIDFLLQRIQFRSIRCSAGSNSTAPSTVPTPNS